MDQSTGDGYLISLLHQQKETEETHMSRAYIKFNDKQYKHKKSCIKICTAQKYTMHLQCIE